MTGYFSRLAQRSGALAPAISRPVTPTDAVGLVEQESFVEVPPSSPQNVSAPARASAPNEMPKPPPTPSMTVTSSAPLSVSPASQARIGEERISASPVQGLAPGTVSTSRMTSETPAGREGSKKSDDAAVLPSAPIRRAVEESTLPRALAVAKDGSNAAPAGATSQRDDGQVLRSTMISSPQQRTSREILSTPASMEPLSRRELREHPWSGETERSSVMVERIEKHTGMPASSGLATEGGSMAAPNIEVRIGAVRLEIHGQPAPTPAPASATPPAERPRFAPRRHYLRS